MDTTQASSSDSALAALDGLLADLEALYEDAHAHPELSMQETRTAAVAAERPRGAGFDVTTGVGRTGVVGVLRNADRPTVPLRADMDFDAGVRTRVLAAPSGMHRRYAGSPAAPTRRSMRKQKRRIGSTKCPSITARSLPRCFIRRSGRASRPWSSRPGRGCQRRLREQVQQVELPA